MQNIVSLEPDRPRPPRILGVPRSGARILFFTGVRYCRSEDAAEPAPGAGAGAPSASERRLDATAH